MINFSGLNYKSWMGKLLRWPLHLLPREMQMPIWQGRLKGKRWIVGSLNHGCWLGSYEHEKQSRMAEGIRPGSVFFDVGANVGFYTLLASSLVGESGKVFSFEPLPRNIKYLERHLQINSVDNVTLFKAAVAERPGTIRFQQAALPTMGRVSDAGDLTVECVALDDLYARALIPLPDCMNMDVEGAEVSVLRGAQAVLAKGRPKVFLATHGADVHAECVAILQSLGYSCCLLEGSWPTDSNYELIAENASAVGL